MLETTKGASLPRRREGRLKEELSSTQQRVFLIQDAISGLGYQMSAPETVIFPFVDYLSVLLQAGRIISIWDKTTNKIVFSTLGDEALIDKYGQLLPQDERLSLWDSDYEIQVDQLDRHRYGTRKEITAYTSQLDSDYEIINRVLSYLGRSGTTPVNRQSDAAFSLKIIEAISAYKRPEHTQPDAIKLKLKEISDLLLPMRNLLDEVFFDLKKSHVFQVVEDDFDIVKLFAVVRTVPSSRSRYNGFFNYTASLLLSVNQYSAIRQLLEKERSRSRAEQLMEYLESPLGLEDRSVADIVFSSGNVGFGGRVGSEVLDVASGKVAKQRQDVEDFVYKRIHQVDKEADLHVFYVPVHVGGVPWLAFFTFTDKVPRNDHESWKRNYRIYRDVIPKVTSQIRTGTKEIYLRLLADKLTAHLHSWKVGAYPVEELGRRVSEDWQKINQIYPYDRVQLEGVGNKEEERLGEMMLRLDEGCDMFIKVMEGSTFLRRDVNYDLLDKERIKKACDAAVQRYLRLSTSLQQQTAAYNTHNLRNPLIRLRTVLLDSNLSSDTAKAAIDTQIGDLIALEQFSNYLITGKPERKPAFIQIQDGTFPVLRESIDNALKIFEIGSYASNSAKILRKIRESGTLTSTFSGLEILKDTASLSFCAEQINVVVNGLISNALKYNKLLSPALYISVSADENHAYLHVRNPSSKSPGTLRELAKDLSNPADMFLNFVGVNLIHLACHACRYSPPVWKEEGGELVATVQVARRIAPRNYGHQHPRP